MILETITERRPILKGWSCDKKFCAVDFNGKKYLLRITPFEKSGTRNDLFALLKRVYALGIPMCKPLEAGICNDGFYLLYSWIDGSDAENVIPFLQQKEQYNYGVSSGQMLKLIHSIPAPDTLEEWHVRYNRKIDRKIQNYLNCGLRFSGDETVLSYLREHRNVFQCRPQSFQHGDFHIGNMMLENSRLIIIDFDRYDFGDPWEEFNRIVWCAQSSPAFATGMIDGYFDSQPPLEFWQCLAFYIGCNTLSSVSWAIDFGSENVRIMLHQASDILSWYDNFHTVVPAWYTHHSIYY